MCIKEVGKRGRHIPGREGRPTYLHFLTNTTHLFMVYVVTRTPEPARQWRFIREEHFRMAETGVLGPEDRTEKLVCYASNDIPEYWIANLQSYMLECYHDSAGDEYRE